ncbi:MAG: hypothetical protein KKF93_04455 [Candidatus Omnitrophica bacterium]|nr:hypothetical protein [Candidatus Omnitrophota bacterium]MBU2063628.1 hypothetical protein [Candidatus Omnitrophota bacterium]
MAKVPQIKECNRMELSNRYFGGTRKTEVRRLRGLTSELFYVIKKLLTFFPTKREIFDISLTEVNTVVTVLANRLTGAARRMWRLQKTGINKNSDVICAHSLRRKQVMGFLFAEKRSIKNNDKFPDFL